MILQLHISNAAAPGDDVHAIVGLQVQSRASRGFISSQARGDKPLEDRNLTRLGARVPVLDRSPGVQHERKFLVGCSGNGCHSTQISLARPSSVSNCRSSEYSRVVFAS